MREKILITVKTYPTPSTKYGEVVCTAGMRADGTWVRIYPIPYRKLDNWQKYEKYQWIELDLERNLSDFRLESHKPKNFNEAILGEVIGTGKDKSWDARKKIVLQNVYDDMNKLIADSKMDKKYTSLAVYKPKVILDLVVKRYPDDVLAEYNKRKRALEEKAKQIDVFSGEHDPFELAEKIPYKFSYRFLDSNGNKRTLMIEDWEINQLYRNCLERSKGREDEAVMKVREKYFDDFVKTKDLYLFLGTTKSNHMKARNPFIIIGVFYPKIQMQGSLF
jgi:hypothetical protein